MDVTADIPRARSALEFARMEEAERITEAVQAHRVVGVLGEGEVGKTETVRQVLGRSVASLKVIRLDLDGAASDDHVGFLLAKQIARAQLGETNFSLLAGGVLLPTAVEAGRLELAELLGLAGLEEAMLEWPSGSYSMASGLKALEALAANVGVILWIDHLEASSLTPRHPLQLDRLLWGVRELGQRVNLGVVLTAREAIEGKLLGSAAAFHQQGQWLTIDNPPIETWRDVATTLKVSPAVATELAEMTGGHPSTMLLALLRLAEADSVRHPHEILRQLVARDAGLIGRAMQHARSLHRLGGQVMIQVAFGQPPYGAAQRGRSPAQETRKVLERLRLAGLLRHDVAWSLVNPLIAIGLRGGVHQLTPLERIDRPEL
jgi:hypothetical protein